MESEIDSINSFTTQLLCSETKLILVLPCCCYLVTKSCSTLATPWTTALSSSVHRSGLPFPFPGGLSNPGAEPPSLRLADGFFISEPLGALSLIYLGQENPPIKLMTKKNVEYLLFLKLFQVTNILTNITSLNQCTKLARYIS